MFGSRGKESGSIEVPAHVRWREEADRLINKPENIVTVNRFIYRENNDRDGCSITIDPRHELYTVIFFDEFRGYYACIERRAVVISDDEVNLFETLGPGQEWRSKYSDTSHFRYLQKAEVFPIGREQWRGGYPATGDVVKAFEEYKNTFGQSPVSIN